MLFSKQTFEKYLPVKLGQQAVKVHSVEQFTRGSSRETWFLSYETPASAKPISLVIRRDMPDGSIIPSRLDHEFGIYDRLSKTDVPVAKPLWWEDDPNILCGGAPFYVREHIEGSWELPGYTGTDPALDDMRISAAKEHVRKLAIVHSVDWRGLHLDRLLPAPSAPELAGQHIVDVYQKRIESLGGEPLPILPEAFEWLRENAPAASQICLCKGTNGLGEEVFRDGQIVAMSDWEEASIGDPAIDFAFCQNFMQEIERDGIKKWGLVQALQYYEELTNRRIAPQTVQYYHLIRALATIEFSINCAKAIGNRESGNPRKAFAATEVISISKRMLASALGLIEPIPPSRYYDMVDME